MTIKHIVISGGGPTCIKALGVIQHLEKCEYLNMKHIESIYATSGGAFIATMICLQFDWQTINDYILLRPWHEAYHIGVNQIFDAFSKKGLFDENLITIFFKPFFKAKDISMDITLSDFFELTKIDLHMFTLEINKFEMIDISYKTHPDIKLLTAIHMTSALPIVISPVCIDNKCYVDGGVMCNYPLKNCFDNVLANGFLETEILGIKNNYEKDVGETDPENNSVNNESTILDYMFTFINKLVCTVSTENIQPTISNEIVYKANYMSFYYLTTSVSSSDIRKELLDDGIKTATEFLQKINFMESNNKDDTSDIIL